MNRQEIVQAGEGTERDLMIWYMGDLQADLRRGAPKDSIVYYYFGAGTSNYEDPPSIEDVEKDLLARPDFKGVHFKTVTVAGWSAGGRAVQRTLAKCVRTGRWPDAVLVADGLYAPYANAATKAIDMTKLEPVIQYGTRVARDASAGKLILWHSDIPTPGYASSSECVAAVRKAIENQIGLESGVEVAPPELDGRPIKAFWSLNSAVTLSYAGRGKEEHIAEVHMIDEVMRTYCPWFTDDNKTDQDNHVYFPEVVVSVDGDKDSTLVGALLGIARDDLRMGVREYDSRVTHMLRNAGAEPPNNWCASAFKCWLDEAASETGHPQPIAGSAGAKATMYQFQKAGLWTPKGLVKPEDLKVGWVPVYDRSTPGKPETAWKGHIDVISQVDGTRNYKTIGGNAGPNGDRVFEGPRSLDDPKLLGFGRVG